MTDHALEAVKEDLRGMIASRLNVRGKSFRDSVRRAGRRLPARARVAAAELEALEARLAHPKLAARTDPAHLRKAAETIRTSLAGHRPGVRAERDRSFLMAEIGFRLAVVIGLGLALLHWQAGV